MRDKTSQRLEIVTKNRASSFIFFWRYTRRVLEANAKVGRLKVLQRWGTGYDAIDIKAAKEFGIKVNRATSRSKVRPFVHPLQYVHCTVQLHAHFRSWCVIRWAVCCEDESMRWCVDQLILLCWARLILYLDNLRARFWERVSDFSFLHPVRTIINTVTNRATHLYVTTNAYQHINASSFVLFFFSRTLESSL